MTLTINYLENHLQKWKQERPGSYKACCPAHDDDSPSLSVKEENGRILLYCHAGCSYDQIIAALGQTTAVNGNGGPKPVAIKEQPKRQRLTSIYSYQNATGDLQFQKLRYEVEGGGKSFKVRRPTAPDKFTWGIGEAERVIYNLPQLLARPDDPIYVVEGEKDADRLISMGLLATCNFDGAGKWLKEYNQHFTGRRVIILADNDKAGREHANLVANNLAAGPNGPIAKSVKVLQFPDLPEHGDVSDWLDADPANDLPALLKLIDDTAPYVVRPYIEGTPKTKDYFSAFRALGYDFRLNDLNNEVEVNGTPITDGLEARINNQMRDWSFNSTTRIKDAWMELAWRNSYHPMKQYLDGLKWDGQDHLNQFFSYMTFNADKIGAFGPVAWKRWLVGSVAKIYHHHQNFMLVVDGPQDLGKSTLARWLCPLPEFHREGGIKPEDKDDLLRMATMWIWEVAELQGVTRKADREQLKSFITMEKVTVRKAYARHDISKPATVSFFGTINEDGAGFLSDTTGNRRFVIIRIEKLDHAYSKETNLDQLWAQVVHLYKNGEPWRLTPGEASARDAINDEYMASSIVAIYLFEHYEVDPHQTSLHATTHEIMATLKADGLTGSQQEIQREVARLLIKAGAERIRSRGGSGRATAYRGVFPRKLTDKDGGG